MAKPESRHGRSHDAEGARTAILNAAEEDFAEHGFDGARIDAIAAKANYNKSLIFQYFGDKLGLYAEVIRRADDQVRELQLWAFASVLKGELPTTAQEMRSALKSFVGAYFDYLVEHPRIMRIYNWEMAEGWQTYAQIVSQRERDIDDIARTEPLLHKLQSAGLLRSDFNPLLQVTSLFLCNCYLASIPLMQTLLTDEDLSSNTTMVHAREFICEFIAHGLVVDPKDVQPRKRRFSKQPELESSVRIK